MKNIIPLIVLLCGLLACRQKERIQKSVSFHCVNTVLTKADSLKFIDYEQTDSLLEISKQLLKDKNIAPCWVQYYFLNCYTSILKANYGDAISYSDSVKQVLREYQDQELSERLDLVLGMVYEKLGLYDEALTLYLQCYGSLSEIRYKDEYFRALMGIARIRKKSKNTYNEYLSRLDSLVQKNEELSNGFYWSSLAFFTTNSDTALIYSKKALDYYKKRGNKRRAIHVYCSIAITNLNRQDVRTAGFYLNEMDCYTGGNAINECFEETKSLICLVQGMYHARVEELDVAKEYIAQGIQYAQDLKQYNYLRLLSKMRSDIAFEQGEFAKSRKFLQRSNDYDKKYAESINRDKLRIVDYEYRLKCATNTIVSLEKEQRIKKMGLVISILSISLLLVLLAILYVNRKRITVTLNDIAEKYKMEKLETAKRGEVIKTIAEEVKNPEKSYAAVHKNVSKVLNEVDSAANTIPKTVFDDEELRKRIFRTFLGITESQYKLIVCIYHGADPITISRLLGIKKDAVRMRKARLLKKMGRINNEDFEGYIKMQLKK